MNEETKKRKEFNTKLFEKLLDFIDYFYPEIYETSKENYIHEDEERFKILKDKKNFIEDHNSWFLVKKILPNETNVVKMALSFPEDYFNKKEKKMIRNLLNYKESLFEILNISEDNKIYKIRDLINGKNYTIKTFDLPAKYEKEDIITALIVKDVEDNYFFFGVVQSYDIKNRKKFIETMSLKIMLESTIKEKIKNTEIEWEIEKKNPYKKIKRYKFYIGCRKFKE